MLFELGQIVTTPGARALLGANFSVLLDRYTHGDWGVLDPEDAAMNDAALTTGDRILGSYTHGGQKVWIITEWDRSITTILLPSEY